MINLYNMAVPGKEAPKVELAKMSSEKFYKRPIVKAEDVKVVKEVITPVEVIEAVEVPEKAAEGVKQVSDYLDVNDLTVKELKELLDSKGIEYDAKAKKSELIKLA